MNKTGSVLVIIERTASGYSAYTENVPGIISTGHNINEIQDNMREAIEGHKETLQELGEELPEVIQGEYTLDFRLAIADFFSMMSMLNVSKFAERAGINPSLMRQYASGLKNPRLQQAQKIQDAIRDVSRELGSISVIE